MWSYVADEERIPKDHPLRSMRALIDPVGDDRHVVGEILAVAAVVDGPLEEVAEALPTLVDVRDRCGLVHFTQ
jgi:hypothetical protein